MKYILSLFFLLSSFSIFAYQVNPMVSELLPMGSGSQQTMRIINTSHKKLTIEILAYNLLIDQHGKENLKENDSDFLIIPMTTIIPPGKAQSIIVRYIGEPVLSASEAYRIAVNQVVVDLDDGGYSGVDMTVSFRTLLNVVPKNSKAQLVILSKEQTRENTWNVLLENKGNRYIRLSKAKWVIESENNKLVLEGKELSEALSGKLLLPNSRREISIVLPEKFKADTSTLEVIF
mgnify:CR=1 FL=1|tara:strand:- start:5258 stop:5956 length:699 start_codon:yes stop_codon:yes gene_type:complete